MPNIHKTISSIPLYNPVPNNSKQPYASGGLAAITMLVLSAPLMPFIIGEKLAEDARENIDWGSDIIGKPISILDKGKEDLFDWREYKNGEKVLAYRQYNYQTPTYVATKDNVVIWVLHKDFSLIEYFGHKK